MPYSMGTLALKLLKPPLNFEGIYRGSPSGAGPKITLEIRYLNESGQPALWSERSETKSIVD